MRDNNTGRQKSWRIVQELSDNGLLTFCFKGRELSADVATITRVFQNELSGEIIEKLQGPYSVHTVFSVRGINLTLVDDSDYEVYFCTDVKKDWATAKQLADEIEQVLNEKYVRT